MSISVKSSGLICQHLYEIHPSIRKTSWDMSMCMETSAWHLEGCPPKAPPTSKWGPGFWRWCLMQEVPSNCQLSIHTSCSQQNRKKKSLALLLWEVHSVDGSEILLTCWSGTYPNFLESFSTIPGGCLGFLPSTVTPDPSVKKGPKDI